MVTDAEYLEKDIEAQIAATLHEFPLHEEAVRLANLYYRHLSFMCVSPTFWLCVPYPLLGMKSYLRRNFSPFTFHQSTIIPRHSELPSFNILLLWSV